MQRAADRRLAVAVLASELTDPGAEKSISDGESQNGRIRLIKVGRTTGRFGYQDVSEPGEAKPELTGDARFVFRQRPCLEVRVESIRQDPLQFEGGAVVELATIAGRILRVGDVERSQLEPQGNPAGELLAEDEEIVELVRLRLEVVRSRRCVLDQELAEEDVDEV